VEGVLLANPRKREKDKGNRANPFRKMLLSQGGFRGQQSREEKKASVRKSRRRAISKLSLGGSQRPKGARQLVGKVIPTPETAERTCG